MMTNKDLLNLVDAINAKKAEVKDFVEKDLLDEAKVAKEELITMQDKFNIMKDMVEEPEEREIPTNVQEVQTQDVDPIHAFAEAARRGFKNDALAYSNEGTASQGGYTVPQDIQTKINKFKEARFNLESLVTTTPVSTSSGSRIYQTRASHTGFASVAEAGKIAQKAAPTFSQITYAIAKYAGYLPVTNELLADSDANIANTIIEWLGEEDIATRNAIILAALADINETDLANLDGIKTAVNVTLGQAFAGSVQIVTNDDGFNYLDQLKNGQSEYLLKPSMDPTKPLERRLAVGATTIPVVVVPNAVLASTKKNNKDVMPFYIGDFKDAVTIFDRQKISIMQSNTASVTDFNAFEQDLTIFRAIERLDCKLIDSSAVVRGTITAA